jgi:hypothetical protein
LADVNYLTQQFVDQLCSTESQSDELLEEIKRVVFLAHEPSSRMGATDFDALVALKSSGTQLAAEALTQRLDRLSQEVLDERTLRDRLPGLEKQLVKNKQDLKKTEDQQKELVRPGGKARAEYYGRLNAAVTDREQTVQLLQRWVQVHKNLQGEVERYLFATFPRLLADLQRTHTQAQLTDKEWAEFLPKFAGDPQALLCRKIELLEKAVQDALKPSALAPSAGLTVEQLNTCSLATLKEARDEVGKLISLDDKNAQRLAQLNGQHATLVASGRKLEEAVKRAQDQRRANP